MVGYDGFDASLSYKEIRAIRCLFFVGLHQRKCQPCVSALGALSRFSVIRHENVEVTVPALAKYKGLNFPANAHFVSHVFSHFARHTHTDVHIKTHITPLCAGAPMHEMHTMSEMLFL